MEWARGMQQKGRPGRLRSREGPRLRWQGRPVRGSLRPACRSLREEMPMNKLSDIFAVMGLATVFVAIAMMIACWG